MKAYLVTKERGAQLGPGVEVIHIPFVEEDTLYVFDEKTGYVEIRGRDRIVEFLNRLKNGRRISQ
ncbi:hypothetical protein [Pyrobaculum aerophilum]|uniref:Uncharacterized protein n=1 Tax=Pyrobaculum aerophilum TaxID=13773 RepID=A0A371R725_9CREN|nr:hypothetical protein [Pyrobaculum aerophilum]MCX8136044.1 hypothetical protein [Pyrobaculum aerophilum]RFA93471.1 hypothetical protein CGL51_12875 [Pyrobaculum aerophilum]RFB00344.1 hypothetical protein CGL52_00305 [Pyrobaculum aerophilum]HII47407.1 hypothetical protein [Pyrobaculum aerophilum]